MAARPLRHWASCLLVTACAPWGGSADDGLSGDDGGVSDGGTLGDGGGSDCPSATLLTDTIAFDEVGLGGNWSFSGCIANDCEVGTALEAAVTVEGDDEFSWKGSNPIIVEAGGIESCTLVFDAQDYEAHSATLTLETNTSEGTLSIALTGQAVPE